MSATVFAASTSQTNTDPGSYGSHSKAYVKVYYTTPGQFTGEEFLASRDPGTGQFDGAFYYCFFIDEEYYQGYDNDDEHDFDSDIDCTLAATYTTSDFKLGYQEWTCTALANLP
ncbi:MAG: hypothetical protein ACOWW1_07265 [archaeon]